MYIYEVSPEQGRASVTAAEIKCPVEIHKAEQQAGLTSKRENRGGKSIFPRRAYVRELQTAGERPGYADTGLEGCRLTSGIRMQVMLLRTFAAKANISGRREREPWVNRDMKMRLARGPEAEWLRLQDVSR